MRVKWFYILILYHSKKDERVKNQFNDIGFPDEFQSWPESSATFSNINLQIATLC